MKKTVFLFLTCAIAFSGCGMFKSKKDKKPDVTKRAKADLREENSDVDFQAFLGRLKQAIAAHDVGGQVADDLFGKIGLGETAASVWSYARWPMALVAATVIGP